jgi:hypothetical protein
MEPLKFDELQNKEDLNKIKVITSKKSGIEKAKELQESFDKWVQENKELFKDYLIERNENNVYKKSPDDETAPITKLQIPFVELKLDTLSELKHISFLIKVIK